MRRPRRPTFTAAVRTTLLLICTLAVVAFIALLAGCEWLQTTSDEELASAHADLQLAEREQADAEAERDRIAQLLEETKAKLEAGDGSDVDVAVVEGWIADYENVVQPTIEHWQGIGAKAQRVIQHADQEGDLTGIANIGGTTIGGLIGGPPGAALGGTLATALIALITGKKVKDRAVHKAERRVATNLVTAVERGKDGNGGVDFAKVKKATAPDVQQLVDEIRAQLEAQKVTAAT